MRFLKRLDRRITGELAAQRRLILPGLICAAITAALLGAYAPIVDRAVNAVASKDATTLTWLSLAIIVVFFVRYWFARGQLYYLGTAANRMTSDLRIRVYEKLQRLPLQFFHERRAGAIQSVLTNDVNVFNGAVGAVRDSITGPIQIVVGTVAIFVIQPWLALAACAVLPFMALVIQRNGKRMKVAQGQVQVSLSDLTAMMQESLNGMRIVKAFGAERRFADLFSARVEQAYESQRRTVSLTASLKPMVELIGAVAIAVVVIVCGQLVLRDMLNIGQLTAFLFMLDVINKGAGSVGQLNQTYAQVQAATDRIYGEILDQPDARDDDPGALTLDRVEGRVEFRDVSFAYPDGTQALSGVSFTIEPGQSVALVGPSGAGKSTIADLLLRFSDPTSGQITLDGVDLRQLRASWLRSQIGVVPQQTFLFAGPVRENIRMGLPSASQEQVEAAARAAHADGFIESAPNGYDTELGERGVRLSGGEGQRLAIARALVRNPAILLLDEATSNLDAHSERAVSQALEEIMKDRTTLFIAHRLTTAARADKIVVLRHGQVLEEGTHEQLMAAEGPYAGMYRSFTSGLMEA